MHGFQEAWAQHLHKLLVERDMTNTELAARVGVHPSTISRVRSGKLVPDDDLKWLIAGVLGMRMDLLWPYPPVVPNPPQPVAA